MPSATSLINRLGRLRRRWFEMCGSARYSRPARDGLDVRLQDYLPPQGFFIEAGALDGYTASNTYYLEKIKGWTGLLVEPSPPEARGCALVRSRSHVVNCALVPFDFSEQTIQLTYGADLSFVNGAYAGTKQDERVDMIRRYRKPETFNVPARTLTSVLDEVKPPQVDFVSLDVEGFELSVLKGLDFDRYRPRAMLIECQTDEARDAMDGFLSPLNYRLEGKLTRHDYLFLRS